MSETWESEIAYNHGVADERERITSILGKESHDTKYVITVGVFEEVHDEKYCKLCIRLRKINGEEFK